MGNALREGARQAALRATPRLSRRREATSTSPLQARRGHAIGRRQDLRPSVSVRPLVDKLGTYDDLGTLDSYEARRCAANRAVTS